MNLFVCVTVLGCLLANLASADSQPSFSHKGLAEYAGHVVLVTEGEKIDGILTVLATYKGNIPVGSTIEVPELGALQDPAKRKIYPSAFAPNSVPKHSEVTCRQMILFLDADGDKLKASGFAKSFTRLCWIEDGVVYAKTPEINPGTSSMLKAYSASLETIVRDITPKAVPSVPPNRYIWWLGVLAAGAGVWFVLLKRKQRVAKQSGDWST